MSEVNVSQLGPEVCTTCGNGTLRYRFEKSEELTCSYCEDIDQPAEEHRHKLGAKISGLQKCVGHRYLGCDYEKYDSQWGAGMFNDWPTGHHKPYGA